MKKTVVVRKNKERRIGIRFFTVALMMFLGMLVLCAQSAYCCLAIICAPIAFSSLAILIYYESWRISFLPDKITKSAFYIPSGDLSYAQIKDVTVSRSSTEYDHVSVVFSNGEHVRFRCDDDNADKALKRILSHHSMRRI